MPGVAVLDPEVRTKEVREGSGFWDPVTVERAREKQGRSWETWARSMLGLECTEVEAGGWRVQKPVTVVYGHDSKRGLNLKRWSKGLDSGCVNGGRLSALVVDAWGRQDLVSVGCEGVERATED